MSINIINPPTVRPFRGFADPALPDGYWIHHGSVLGDSSGGLRQVIIRFSTATDPNVSTLWNLEQLTISSGENGAATASLDYGNMDVQPPGNSTGGLFKVYLIALPDFGAVSVLRSMDIARPALPLFLGAAGKEVNGQLLFSTDNVLNASFTVAAQGYFWGPAALNAPGGPQRPATGLFGR